MKMLSRKDCIVCTELLDEAIKYLKCCNEKMKGKYGTAEAAINLSSQ